MKEIKVEEITEAVEELCLKANCFLNHDIYDALKAGEVKEESLVGKDVLGKLIKNAEKAKAKVMPICQDTGMAVVFCEVGQDIHIAGGSLTEAINEGIRKGYKNGFMRFSVVSDPLERVNSGDNTPAVIHYEVVEGDALSITLCPKGFGAENMSGVAMLTPSQGLEGVKKFIVETVAKAGPNPCPPIVVGVGIGGTMEKAAFMAKKALIRPIDETNSDSKLAALERELLEEINKIGIGPAGFGGTVTALKVNIEKYATHIAGLPVAVNLNCHATRHAQVVLHGRS